MQVLVTGASGFIGRMLCRRLRSEGVCVIGASRSSRFADCDRYLQLDLARDRFPVESLVGVDVVFHLAGKAHALSETRQDEAEYDQVNRVGTRNILDASRQAGVRRFVLFSTIKASSSGYSVSTSGPGLAPRLFSETDSVEPDTAYGRSKRDAEQLVLQGRFVPEPVALRPCMVYGTDAKGNILRMLDAIRRGRFPPLPEIGNLRSMVHVEDVVSAALLCATHPNAPHKIFIVSDGIGYSTRQIYELMCAALKRPVPSWHLPVWTLALLGLMGDQIGRLRGRRFVFDSDALEKLIGSAWYSSKFIEEQLGFRPRWNLERALPEMVAALPPVSVR